MFWYQSQLVCVKWGKVVSNCFGISNGVRQGGILSPNLFALYMNKLSRLLVMSNVGCYIDGQCMNHLMYADDIFILAPTAIAMQQLLDICNDYGVANDITFNPLKSVCSSLCQTGTHARYSSKVTPLTVVSRPTNGRKRTFVRMMQQLQSCCTLPLFATPKTLDPALRDLQLQTGIKRRTVLWKRS